MAHRTQENMWCTFTGLFRRIRLWNNQMEQMYRTRYDRRAAELPCCLWVCLPLSTSHTSIWSPAWKLAKSWGSRVFLVLSFLRGQMSGTEISNPLIPWSFWWLAPSWGCLEAHTQSSHEHELRYDQGAEDYRSGNSKSFKSSVLGIRDKDQRYFLLYHNYKNI